MGLEELARLRKLIDKVICAPSKAAAQPYVSQLEFAASTVTPKVNPYFAGKLREAVIYAKHAAGQVRDKDHRISCMKSSWSVFESHVKHDLADTGNA